MNTITNFINSLPLYLLSIPVILFALSVHETAHGYVAYRLGDPTAHNFGRLSLNPVKHIDPIGFIMMLLFHVGWAKPVPINTRHFKNPRRDMALTGAAGPISNLLLAVINFIILAVVMIFAKNYFAEDASQYLFSLLSNTSYTGSVTFTIMSLVVYILYVGVSLNISLAVFNLIPIPPFDGSRIFYAFLPEKLYFKVMKYEQIIMIVILALFFFGLLDGPFNWVMNNIMNGLFSLGGMSSGTTMRNIFSLMYSYVTDLLSTPLI